LGWIVDFVAERGKPQPKETSTAESRRRGENPTGTAKAKTSTQCRSRRSSRHLGPIAGSSTIKIFNTEEEFYE
jgi:hypothetical protein